MNLLSEFRTALRSDLNVSSSSSLFPEGTIDLALNRAYIKCYRLFRWPMTDDALKTSTAANQEYYDAPQNWSPNSMFRLEVNGDMYGIEPDGSPMDFADYLAWKQDNPNSTDKRWAVQNLRYFINPIPTSVGSNNITIWGQKIPSSLASASDTTIFSYNMPECNEAMVLEAGAILRQKGDTAKTTQTGDDILSVQAKNILIIAFNRLKQEKAKYQKILPFLEVPDLFGPANPATTIGRF